MKTIPEVVEKIILEKPFLHEALAEGLVNVSALARKIQPEIQSYLSTPAGIPAISMAIKRMDFTINAKISLKMTRVVGGMGDIIVRSDLSSFTYQNSSNLGKSRSELMKLIRDHNDVFCTISQGVFETNFVISEKIEDEFKGIFKNEQQLNVKENLASLTVKLPSENTELPGLYYFFFKNLTWKGINILEVISTTNEFTVIVDNKDIDVTFSTIKGLKNTLF
mgnify:FL=1